MICVKENQAILRTIVVNIILMTKMKDILETLFRKASDAVKGGWKKLPGKKGNFTSTRESMTIETFKLNST